jgi:hypothetical protein
VLGKPARRFCFGDDREDFDGFTRDVIAHSQFPQAMAFSLVIGTSRFDRAPGEPRAASRLRSRSSILGAKVKAGGS